MTNNQMDSRQRMGQGCCCSGISWSAIFAGAFVAIGLSFLLNAFATSIGVSAFTITDNVATIAIGGFIALLIGVVVVMFASGWVAGFLNQSCSRDHCTGGLSGFLSWCLALTIAALLMAQLGQLLNVNYAGSSSSANASTKLSPSLFVEVLPSNKTATADHGHSGKSSSSATASEGEKMMNSVVKALFLTFLLFFCGAAASTYGGHRGMKSCRKHDLRRDRE